MLVLFQVDAMDNRALLAFVFTIFAVSGFLQAYSTQGISALMAQYSVPASVTSALNASNMTYSGDSYVALYRGSQLYFLVNVTNPSGYSLVLNANAIYDVIKGRAISTAALQADLSALVTQMREYQASAATPLMDCYQETGLASGETCTVANNCFSCMTVPICSQAVAGNYTLALGIMTFSGQYQLLNKSLNSFYSAASAANSTNAQAELSRINAAFGNISSVTRTIYENPIFPPTSNITASMYAAHCLTLSSSNLPWYCTAIGFCGNVNYNYTKLAKMQAMVNGLEALPVSDSQIRQAAANASRTEEVYVGPVISAQRKAELSQMLNASAPGYGSLVNRSAALLARVSNASLSQGLSSLKATYSNMTANYVTANLVADNRTLATEYSALSALYLEANATYSSLAGLAENNTAKILELQMGGVAPSAVADLAFREYSLNGELFSGTVIASASAMKGSLAAISQGLSSYSAGGNVLLELARAIDGPFIRAVASGLGMGYSSAVSLAPLLGAILSLIIGIALFALVLLYRSSLHKHHKVVLNHKTMRNWTIVLAFLLVLVLAYVVLTYVLLAYASASAPFGAFSGAIASSKQLVIAVNGTPTSEETACASAIGAAAKSAYGAAVTSASFTNGLCTGAGLTGSVDDCMGAFAGEGVPVAVLTEASSAQALGAYSLYGTRLTVTGPASSMDSCYVQYLFK